AGGNAEIKKKNTEYRIQNSEDSRNLNLEPLTADTWQLFSFQIGPWALEGAAKGGLTQVSSVGAHGCVKRQDMGYNV
ncbi:MAG: hypothetical protein O7D93_09725, partial [Acidobacteria bacterium]|nr:hypothetical protein [Acidobacteriota bacterium]